MQGYLSGGLSNEPHRHVGWHGLALLYKAQGRQEEADRRLQTAVTECVHQLHVSSESLCKCRATCQMGSIRSLTDMLAGLRWV